MDRLSPSVTGGSELVRGADGIAEGLPEAFADAWFHVEIVSPWRSAGTQRFIAAAEVACNEYFNPVIPEVIAEQLRSLG